MADSGVKNAQPLEDELDVEDYQGIDDFHTFGEDFGQDDGVFDDDDDDEEDEVVDEEVGDNEIFDEKEVNEIFDDKDHYSEEELSFEENIRGLVDLSCGTIFDRTWLKGGKAGGTCSKDQNSDSTHGGNDQSCTEGDEGPLMDHPMKHPRGESAKDHKSSYNGIYKDVVSCGMEVDTSQSLKTNMVFDSHHDIVSWVEKAGFKCGVVIVKKSTKLNTLDRQPRMILMCELGGKHRSCKAPKKEAIKRKKG